MLGSQLNFDARSASQFWQPPLFYERRGYQPLIWSYTASSLYDFSGNGKNR